MISVKKLNDIIELAIKRSRLLDKNPIANGIDSNLRNYFEALNVDELRSLEAIIYLGKDEDYDRKLSIEEIYINQLNELTWEGAENEIRQMLGKSTLDIFILKGKEILNI